MTTHPVRHTPVRRERYAEQVYAGVLGKIIGVYLGRPVEGWPYQDITDRFGEVGRYVNDDLGIPLIVADDDISGTLAFARVVLDNPGRTVEAADVGDTWLNYVIEDRTILWWGGMGRSTEHTAYLNLRRGIPAPSSGSIAVNGQTLAEQIGAQIFSDAFGLMHPDDPDRAVALTRAAASVSHDGDALESAGLLAAMRALAFDEPDLDRLLDTGTAYVRSPAVRRLLDDVRANCSAAHDWRDIRDWVDQHYGYARYPGPCHALSNLAMSLGALLGAGDSFPASVMIASSVGFDTDSNAGTVGCLNGVRLGLDALGEGPDLRTPVADRLLVVTADGGECVSDATRETDRILASATTLAGGELPPPRPRFTFAYRGSVQGFTACPYHPGADGPPPAGTGDALRVRLGGPHGPGTAHVSTPTFLDPADTSGNFSTLASPTLYPGQTLTARLSAARDGTNVRPYVLYADEGRTTTVLGEANSLGPTPRTVTWQVPPAGNLVPFRVGFAFTADGPGAEAFLHELDWRGAPEDFEQSGVLLASIWDTKPQALAPWVSSAKNFEADFAVTYSVSHPDILGVVTTGTRDWTDYAVASRLTFSLHETAGLVVRSRGHRRFYAGVFSGGDRLRLLHQRDGERRVLAETAFTYERDRPYAVELRCRGREFALSVDGSIRLTAIADDTLGGGTGFVVERGAVAADGVRISRLAAP
ncbi:ADP-ribosylglycohydrolase family protein [Streptomyces sp. NBC_00038]|uniref:ADP-ribosylglycohydrolase family protein n=1 Tax=Streptomyces sp. NBC_00038 TaxID=2903615 RepID=UPI0022582AF9|nr:ADP-ribosylglycohydrolase family protein [Streptomyces sp. NBC_00038]MCX5554468.1 ADP-ribosylglycohydrolase family protein [Streptomyces sp. NBC_00038]